MERRFELVEHDGQQRQKAFTASQPAMAIDVAARTARFLGTPETVDAEGEVLLAAGCLLDRYLANPTVDVQHDHERLPVGKALSVVPEPGVGVWVTVEFTDLGLPAGNEHGDLVEAVWAMVQAGTLRGMSVEFIPHKVSAQRVLAGQSGVTHVEWEPVAFSVVAIPCNAGALVKGLQADRQAATLLWPESVKALEADPEAVRQAETDQRATEYVQRATSALSGLADLALAKQAQGALEGVANWLRGQVKGLPASINRQAACRMLVDEKGGQALARTMRRAYSVTMLVGDDKIRQGLLDAIMEIGKLTGAHWIDEDTLRWCYGLEEDDLEGDAWMAEPGGKFVYVPARVDAPADSEHPSQGRMVADEDTIDEGQKPCVKQFAPQTHAAPSGTPAAHVASGADPCDDQGRNKAATLTPEQIRRAAEKGLLAGIEAARRADIGGNRHGNRRGPEAG